MQKCCPKLIFEMGPKYIYAQEHEQYYYNYYHYGGH